MPLIDAKPCGAKTKNGKGECRQPAMENGRCRLHGGKTPRGVASPNYKHGGYSQSIPARLASRYEESVNDSELLSIRYDIALLKTRIDDVLEASERGESGELWNALREAKREYRQANKDEVKQEALERILWLIEEGYQEWQTWKDVRFMLQERKTLVEAEEKRIEKMQQILTVEELMSTVGVLMNIIQEEVVDRKSRQRIEERIGKLLTRQ